MEIRQELCQAHPASRSTSMVTLWHPAFSHSGPALAPATPAPQPLPPGIPMDHCLLGLEVRYLSTAEQEELLLQLLAAKDAAGAPSPDEPAPKLAQEESGAYAPLPGSEEDF
ncbi:hypothetical protein C0993_011893 [Termitomyces sp. T159_Od127]|nr:hypothetical protein C0993_011893 [Termitomyces sp. T159_Od127]